MALVMTSGPASEPVTVSEAKAHLRLDGADEDLLIASLILTSRLHIEAALGLALLTQAWRFSFDCWPDDAALVLPLRPVQSVSEVRTRDSAGMATVIDAADYRLDGQAVPARLIRKSGHWRSFGDASGGVEIDFVAGFGAASDTPEPIRQAILLLVAHWYEHRDPVEIGSTNALIPRAVSDLLAPYRGVRL